MFNQIDSIYKISMMERFNKSYISTAGPKAEYLNKWSKKGLFNKTVVLQRLLQTSPILVANQTYLQKNVECHFLTNHGLLSDKESKENQLIWRYAIYYSYKSVNVCICADMIYMYVQFLPQRQDQDVSKCVRSQLTAPGNCTLVKPTRKQTNSYALNIFTYL